MIILPINAILQGQSYTRPQVDAALALKQNVLTFDETPTANSNNPVKSGGIKTELDGKLPIAENQEQAPVGYILTKTSTGSQWQRASSEGGTIAAAANSYPVTLLAANWSDHTYVVATPTGATITADCDGILGLAPNASAAQVEAFQLAKIVVASQDANGITVVARGQVPTINLNLELTLFMKADYYTKTEEDALLATKAPLGSPALTGTPTAPTAASGTSTTQLATTAFVQNHSNLYGVCSTAAATAAKEVTIDYSGTLTLFTGLTVHVKFSNANAAENPTLNVNGTGAAPIAQYGTTAIPKNTTWPSGSVVTFVYDGTSWIMQSLPQMAGLIWDGLGIPNTDDLDNYVNTGWYWYNTAPTNAPTTVSYCGLHVERGSVNIKQTVYRGGYGNPSAPAEWVRYKYSTSAWTPWVQQVTQMLAADLILHVNATSGDDSNDGLSAANAVQTWAGMWAKIPHDTSGRNVVVYVAAGSYSKLTIDTWHGLSIAFGPETGVSTSDITVAGYEMKATSTLCYAQIANFTFTADVMAYGIYGHSMHRFATCVFDGATLNANGIIYTTTCTFRNNASDAIIISYGLLIAYQSKIENTVTGTGIKASSSGIASINTYNFTNAATTPYACNYTGRIFVGGRTYQEGPSKVTLFQTQTSLGTGTTDITISDDYRKYTFLEFMFSKNSSSTRAILYIHSNSITMGAWYPIAPGGTNLTLRVSNVSGTYTQVRISNLSATGYYLEAINAIP